MQSFYGGRKGSSFVIVKSFQSIRTEGTEFLTELFAREGEYFVVKDGNLITQNEENYMLYHWERVTLDGTALPVGEGQTITLPVQYVDEGMVNFFRKGGETTSEVDYGEYVIINTVDKNNPENGKVFRRGLNYLDEETGGAEYIGQIVGPQGNAPNLYMDNVGDILNTLEDTTIKNKLSSSGYIKDKAENWMTSLYENPSMVTEGENIGSIDVTKTEFNNDFVYAYYSMKDEYGIVNNCKIGFTFPRTKEHFFGVAVEPLYDANKNLVEEYKQPLGDKDQPQTPFFTQWKISIPQGKKGTSLEKVFFSYKNIRRGAPYYQDKELSISSGIIEEKYKIVPVFKEGYISEDYIAFRFGDNPNDESEPIYYMSPKDGYDKVIVYGYRDYENSADGIVTYKEVGNFNDIAEMVVTEAINKKETDINGEIIDATGEGLLLVYYSDPNKRAALTEKEKFTYFSTITGKIESDWHNLGYVKGRPGFITNLQTLTRAQAYGEGGSATDIKQGSILLDENGNHRPPEVVKGSEVYKGWTFAVEKEGSEAKDILFYDYFYDNGNGTLGHWDFLGSVDSSSIEPSRVITQATIENEDNAATLLNDRGFILIEKQIICPY